MFISITSFITDEKDHFSHIVIMAMDSMGKLERIKRFDKNSNNGEWIQVWYLNISYFNSRTEEGKK